MLKILIFGCLHAFAHGLEGADVVLSCSFIEEGGGMGGMMGGSQFTRTPATLVLRDIAIETLSSDLPPETITPYNPPDTPNAEDLIFEVSGSSVEIPEAESLLHADCNEQEVVCELSRYVPRGTEPDSSPAHFIGSIHIEGGGVSLTLVLQTVSIEDVESNNSPLIQTKLQLPLSKWGTLSTDAVFVVFSRSPSIVAPLGDDAVLDCSYRQKDPVSESSLGLEWRWQHRGHGRRILDVKPQGEENDGRMQVNVDREGSSTDPVLLVRDGNASLSMKRLKVSDEGTYICTVSSGVFQTQQIVQVHISQPPKVSLSEKNLIFQDESTQKLSCHCERYYPLDVQVEWFSQPPSDTENISLTEEASLSSHLQHSDGTFSLASILFLRPSDHPPGTVLTCSVSHFALQTSSEVSVTVHKLEPAQQYYFMVIATLMLSVLFLYQAIR